MGNCLDRGGTGLEAVLGGRLVVDFEILGEITQIKPIARGTGVRDRARLRKQYGPGRWRKLKGVARVRLLDNSIRLAEIHWYEAHGIGKKEFKLKLPFLG